MAPDRSLVRSDPVLSGPPRALLIPRFRAKLLYKEDARRGKTSVRGHVRRRGNPDAWEYTADIGLA